jgi:hypothetical protein
MTALIDAEFRNTGWNPQCFRVSASPATQIYYKLTSLGDPYDRFVALIVNGVEIVRAITPFDYMIEQKITIPEPLAGAFSLGDKVCGIVTTYIGGWRYFAETVNEVTPTEYPVPIFTVETMNSSNRRLSKTVSPFHAIRGYLYATGHYYEEGAVKKRFRVIVDDKTVFDRDLDWGWSPGCGYIKPYEFTIDSTVSTIVVESPNCGDYWKVSLALTTETPPMPWIPALILGSMPVVVVGTIITYNELVKSRLI